MKTDVTPSYLICKVIRLKLTSHQATKFVIFPLYWLHFLHSCSVCGCNSCGSSPRSFEADTPQHKSFSCADLQTSFIISICYSLALLELSFLLSAIYVCAFLLFLSSLNIFSILLISCLSRARGCCS